MKHPLLVNVGCGNRFHKDWINLDLHSSSPDVRVCDLTKGIPLQSDTADALYSAAVLEHIRIANVNSFLLECQRVLKPGGIIRIAVPDFEQQVKTYLTQLETAKRGDTVADWRREWMIIEMIDQVGRERSGGSMAAILSQTEGIDEDFVAQRIGEEGRDLINSLKNKQLLADPDFTNSRYHLVRGRFIGRWIVKWLLRSSDLEADLAALEVGRFRLRSGELHRWVYDTLSLKNRLAKAGFVDLAVCSHGESCIPNWETYHLEVNKGGRVEKPDLLIVEGKKAD